MDIQRIITILEREDTVTRLYFTNKRSSNYFSYSASLSNDLQNEIKGLIKNYLNYFIDLDQTQFSPLGYREKTIETYKINDISNYNDVIESYKQ